MSHWCKSHPRYSAKREPNSLCGDCWAIWFYRCPEAKPALQQVYAEAEKIEPKTEDQ